MQSPINSVSSGDSQQLLAAISKPDLNIQVFLDHEMRESALMLDAPNPYSDKIGSKYLNSYIRKKSAVSGRLLKTKDLEDTNEGLKAAAQISGLQASVWNRVAQIPNGIEIDLGDDSHRRVSVLPNRVSFLNTGSKTIFFRNPHMGSIPVPEEISSGVISKLNKYLNMSEEAKVLTRAWLSYTIAHPKVESTKYPILVLSGSQGTGKTVMSNLILKFADPGSLGVRTFPHNVKELAIACQASHVLAYDNLRYLSPAMADALCIASTGGSLTVRQLYTDADVFGIRLHGAVILNGLHPFVNQSDLAQRCLTIELQPISKKMRQTDAALQESLKHDYADIHFGLLDLISKVFAALPNIQLEEAERMAEFSKWLAAMELVEGVPEGTYQKYYSDQIVHGQLDALQDNLFASELLAFGKHQSAPWIGTPTQLFKALSERALGDIGRSREWPENAIAMSKRILPLIAPLDAQGIQLQFKRGKQRQIIITNTGGEHDLY